jgi:phage tail sheath protein FI
MPETLHPGVYVQEKSSGVKPIEGVGTSTAGFIGVTQKGVPNKATFITSWSQFVRAFGYLIEGSYLPYAVQQFFANGGKRCYVVRVLSATAARAASVDLLSRQGSGGRNSLRIRAKGAGEWGNALGIVIDAANGEPAARFKLTVTNQGEVVETFDGLSMDPADADGYVETQINDASEYIEVEDLKAATQLANGQPVRASATSTNAITAGPYAAPNHVLTIEAPDGSTANVDISTVNTAAALVDLINGSFGPFGVAARLITAAESAADAGKLRLTHNSAGYESYFVLGGRAATAGVLIGMAGLRQGRGAATAAQVRSRAVTTFNTGGGNNVLTVAVGNPATSININLTADAAAPIDTLVAEIRAALTANANGLASVRRTGDCILIETANRGANDSTLTVTGTAAGTGVLDMRPIDRTQAVGTAANGQGASEAAFLLSNVEPFQIEENANFSIAVNNGALNATLQALPSTFKFVPNATTQLQKATAAQLAAQIEAAAATVSPRQITATSVNGRVRIAQVRRGNAYTLQLTDGAREPNLRLKFPTSAQTGTVDGDAAAPAVLPRLSAMEGGAPVPTPLANGTDGAAVSNFDLIGTADRKSGMHALDDVTDINFFAIPGCDAQVTDAAVAYCANRGDCFFIADAPGMRDRNTRQTQPVHAQNFMRNVLTVKSSYGALYYPWIQIADPVGPGKNPRRYVPPSGFIAGLFARIDNSRGVWKAPAGTEANVFGGIGLEYGVTDAEQDILNPIGVNCIRQFPASGMVVWGARTLAAQADPEYRYVPVRRYTNYLKQSIYNGTQWAVFEPNDFPLWDALRANIEDFMMGEFRKGALAGKTPEDAFEVKCDADLNPPSEVNAGRVNMQLKFAPLKPAEFVIITISQKTQRPQG